MAGGGAIMNMRVDNLGLYLFDVEHAFRTMSWQISEAHYRLHVFDDESGSRSIPMVLLSAAGPYAERLGSDGGKKRKRRCSNS